MKRKIDLNVTYIYIVNKDLKMSKGKIAAQVSHVAMRLADFNKPIGRAIVLKAPENILRYLIDRKKMGVVYIKDAGLTEVPEGSLTCVGFINSKRFFSVTNHLKLL